jgi:hypothetical protein
MRGQLIFEFIIAGLIFFAILLYTINYLNTNVSGFGSEFYQSRLQSKAAQIAEVLVSGGSNLSIADGVTFSPAKVQQFKDAYCLPAGDYMKFAEDFYLYEKLLYGISPNNARIRLSTSAQTLIDCGPDTVPTHVPSADVERIGLYAGDFARLTVTVW